MSAVPSTVPSPAPATTPSPSEVCEMLESCLKTNPLNQLLVSALEEVRAYDDDVKQIREEGHFHYSAEIHEQVIAQEQEEWKNYYHEVIVPLISEVLAITF
jgi:hypothetical protein